MNNSKKILIVDDNPRFIKALEALIREVLHESDFSIDLALNGEDGLARIEESRFDYIFMDINMPGIGGISAIREADRRYYRNRSKIIAVSFHNELEFIQEVIGAGARHYLVKDEINEAVLSELFQMEDNNHDFFI